MTNISFIPVAELIPISWMVTLPMVLGLAVDWLLYTSFTGLRSCRDHSRYHCSAETEGHRRRQTGGATGRVFGRSARGATRDQAVLAQSPLSAFSCLAHDQQSATDHQRSLLSLHKRHTPTAAAVSAGNRRPIPNSQGGRLHRWNDGPVRDQGASALVCSRRHLKSRPDPCRLRALTPLANP